MANSPSVKKQIIGARISRELYHKVTVLAKKNGVAVSELLVSILEYATREIELSPEHYEQIAEEIRRASSGYNPRKPNTKRKA